MKVAFLSWVQMIGVDATTSRCILGALWWSLSLHPQGVGGIGALRPGGAWAGPRLRSKEEGEQFEEGKDGADTWHQDKPFSFFSVFLESKFMQTVLESKPWPVLGRPPD